MYLQKHGSCRPSELIAAHLERLERERASAEEERRAALAAAGEGHGEEGALGVAAMEEDGEGAGAPASPPGAADVGWDWELGAGPDAFGVRRSRRPKVGCARGCRALPVRLHVVATSPSGA